MRKIAAALVTCLLVLSAAACGSDVISGSVSEVVERCQDITTSNITQTVEATGDVTPNAVWENRDRSVQVILVGEDTDSVIATFEDPNEKLRSTLESGGRCQSGVCST